MRSLFRTALLTLAGFGLAGCVHMQGVVVDDTTGQPLTTAYFTEGTPEVGSTPIIRFVDNMGQFDFRTGVDFETKGMYVHRAKDVAEPYANLMRISRSQAGTGMVVRVPALRDRNAPSPQPQEAAPQPQPQPLPPPNPTQPIPPAGSGQVPMPPVPY
jgi:hypothetical protein